MEVAACKPIANVIDTAVDIFLCSYVTDSVVRNLICFSKLGHQVRNSLNITLQSVILARLFRSVTVKDHIQSYSRTWTNQCWTCF